jgi:hypothetical protein
MRFVLRLLSGSFVLSFVLAACSGATQVPEIPADAGGGGGGGQPIGTTQGGDAFNVVDAWSGTDAPQGLFDDASLALDDQNQGDRSEDASDATINDGSGAVDASADGGPDGDGGCTRLICPNACVDPATDHANCGKCAHPCPNTDACVSGQCRTVTCDAASTVCLGVCVDTETDPANCGGCGTRCPSGATCVMGACACASASQILCPAGCFDITTDPNHCGTCDNSCGPGGMCTAGQCTCATGVSPCGAGCADLMTDPNHCGSCTRRCSMGIVACSAGVCQTQSVCDGGPCCANGYTACGRTTSSCVALQNDPSNCGSCGTACMGRQLCIAGICL